MKPLIGLTPIVDAGRDSLWMLPGYMQGLEAVGGIGMMLPLTDAAAMLKDIVDRVDGLLLTGGNDVAPVLYGETKETFCGENDPRRDRMEARLIELALQADKPVFGICRGLQILNVVLPPVWALTQLVTGPENVSLVWWPLALAAEGKPTHAVLCHRLDTGTSGLVLLAKNNAAEAFLTEAIKKREIEKRYLCVTFGRPNPPAALLRDYLLKDAERGIVRITDTTAGGAKEVITGYETLAVSGRLALLEVELVTGRTHQIRAHLAHIGCPILGDSKYGNNAANRELRLKYQALCAWELKFPAKISDERFAHLTGRVFHAEKPWYCQQVEDGTLK